MLSLMGGGGDQGNIALIVRLQGQPCGIRSGEENQSSHRLNNVTDCEATQNSTERLALIGLTSILA